MDSEGEVVIRSRGEAAGAEVSSPATASSGDARDSDPICDSCDCFSGGD